VLTNLPFGEWLSIFPNAATATALIDRVVHHAEIITIEGESYRRRVTEAKRKSARAPAAHGAPIEILTRPRQSHAAPSRLNSSACSRIVRVAFSCLSGG
jgi:hypothetical protein